MVDIKSARHRDLSTSSFKALYEDLNKSRKELFNLRFQQVLGDLKCTSKFKLAKKDIARIKTELSKRLNGVITNA